MPSINIDLHFFSHRKTMRLAAQLGDQAVTCLIRLWCYAAQHYPDTGSLKDMRDTELEHIMQWRGESGALVRTLVGVGFLDVIDSTCYIHGWGEHARHLTVYRERARKAAEARHSSRESIHADASSMRQAKRQIEKSSTSASSMRQAVLGNEQAMYQYNTLQDNTEEEKRVVPISAKPKRPPILSDADWLRSLSQDQLYAGINIDLLHRKATAWCRERGKVLTRRRFVNWLIKEMDGKPMVVETAQKCQERIKQGNFLKPCGEPSVGAIGGRPLCRAHKEHHEQRHRIATT